MTTPADELPRARGAAASVEERVFQSLMLAADHLLRGEIDMLRTEGLTFPQYNVLRILRGAHPERLSCGTIAERMLTRDSDLTRLLDRLEERSLVSRDRDPRDRRIVTARLTKTGLQLLRRLDGPVARIHRERLAHMSRADLETLLALSHQVRRSEP